jgi:hypothetical protein
MVKTENDNLRSSDDAFFSTDLVHSLFSAPFSRSIQSPFGLTISAHPRHAQIARRASLPHRCALVSSGKSRR